MESTNNFLERRAIPLRENLFLVAQGAIVGSMAIATATVFQSVSAQTTTRIVGLAVAIIVVTLAAALAPWHLISRLWLVGVAVVDMGIITLLQQTLIVWQPGLGIVVIIPVLWLCYTFNIAAAAVSIVAEYAVLLFPFFMSGVWPGSPAEWGRATLLPAIISVVAIAVYFAARNVRRGVLRLLVSEGKLEVSIEQLLDAESSALAVIETVDAGIVFYRPDGTIILANDSARAIRKLAGARSLTAMGPTRLVFGDDRTTPVDAYDQVFERASRGELTDLQTSWVGTGPGQRAVSLTSRYVRRLSGEIFGTVIAMHDVTPLAAALEARDQFLGTVSHELRTPLTSMIGYLEVIEDSVDLVQVGIASEVSAIHRNSERLLALISAMLTETDGAGRRALRQTDLAALVASCLVQIEAIAATAGITVEAAYFGSISAEVDSDQISLVINNVVSNAVKFGSRGGHITVAVSTSGDDAVIAISDDGVGVPASERDRIFDPFFRGLVARTRVTQGSGLGLSTAKIIVEAHLGAIEQRDVPTGGTTFEIRLPLVSEISFA